VCRASAFTLQIWKTVKNPKEFLTAKARKGDRLRGQSESTKERKMITREQFFIFIRIDRPSLDPSCALVVSLFFKNPMILRKF
jgi:hypothetical protein